MKNIFELSGLLIIIVVLITGYILIYNYGKEKEDKILGNIEHIHSIEVDISDSNIVYIATHSGLFKLIGDSVAKVGTDESDFMGFAVHPGNSNIFYSSGHNEGSGQNMGFRISEDKGITWKKLSDGVDGPIDFHSLGISLANSNIVYGWHDNSVQVSSDGGITWKVVNRDVPTIFSFNVHPKNEDSVIAPTWGGVVVSNDRGTTWQTGFNSLGTEPITAIYINPSDEKNIIIFSRDRGLLTSKDGGNIWIKTSDYFYDNIVIEFAGSIDDNKILYALTSEEKIYKSLDSGLTWKLVL